MQMLNGKTAVIYGAGGAIGGAVAQVFAREGAKVFLTGRHEASLTPVAEAVRAAGGFADVAEVDALDERAVDAHLARVVEQTGRLDASFNAVGFPNATILGVPLLELELGRLTGPLHDYTASHFLTSRLAARRMLPQRSGVIMTVTALHARMGLPLVGGYGLAMAAKEALTRQLSVELAPHGIRVLGLRPYAMPETPTIRDAFAPRAKASGLSWEQWQEMLASRTHARRLMKLDELTELAAFLASDRGSGMTGTTVNLTLGSVDD
jgi:NAD(P)-dependent dehydrogenase (short-subunit alcohol dehydrogenase family)